MKSWLWRCILATLGLGRRGRNRRIVRLTCSQSSLNGELQVQWEPLTQTITGRATEEETRCWPLAFTYTYMGELTHPHTYTHMHNTPTPSQTKKERKKKMRLIILRKVLAYNMATWPRSWVERVKSEPTILSLLIGVSSGSWLQQTVFMWLIWKMSWSRGQAVDPSDIGRGSVLPLRSCVTLARVLI